MAIDFYIADRMKSINHGDEMVSLEEKTHNKIYKIYKNNELREGIQILAELDPYGDRVIEIKELELIIENIRKEISLDEVHGSVSNFFKEFIKLSERAIDRKIKVIAIGD
ncbi:hypothetical protein [Tepidibacter sp.]|uniref:hypothetical protein n=1 Tax=Tepidibacter sp. TaxID=2529387 RepID=UPI0025D041AB|nr:hypothetical protein [Tepidibacter sp.]